MTREQKIMKRVREHYTELENNIKSRNWNCEIFGIFLQGSQNYNLDEYSGDYMSDIDTKAIVVPDLRDLIFKKTYSTTIVLDNNEHIDVKDVQTMFEMFKKQNTSYIELLFTDFFIINPKYQKAFEKLYVIRERVARLSPATHALALAGSAHNKYKAMCHVSPHSEEKIAKFGYDPKELCHLIRYESELIRYIENKASTYKDYLLSETKEKDAYLMRVKKGLEYNKEEAVKLGEEIDKNIFEVANNFVDAHPVTDTTAITFLDELVVNIIKIKNK